MWHCSEVSTKGKILLALWLKTKVPMSTNSLFSVVGKCLVLEKIGFSKAIAPFRVLHLRRTQKVVWFTLKLLFLLMQILPKNTLNSILASLTWYLLCLIIPSLFTQSLFGLKVPSLKPPLSSFFDLAFKEVSLLFRVKAFKSVDNRYGYGKDWCVQVPPTAMSPMTSQLYLSVGCFSCRVKTVPSHCHKKITFTSAFSVLWTFLLY